MPVIIRIVFFISMIFSFVLDGKISVLELGFLLIIIAINVYKEKFNYGKYTLIFEALVILITCFINVKFAFLFSIVIYDFARAGLYYCTLAPFLSGVYFSFNNSLMYNLALLVTCFISGHNSKTNSDKINSYTETYDNERRYRYELENMKQKLLESAKNVAFLAETKERNRIAREIHDTVGHSIAGILLQLQVVKKIKKKDEVKSDELLDNSIKELSKTLDVMRETVHNLKPRENIGIDYIKVIIENFKFCKVNFNYNGDFQNLQPSVLEVISSNIKESLTNASKYSRASEVTIEIDINDKYVRTYIKDNGEGNLKIKEIWS